MTLTPLRPIPDSSFLESGLWRTRLWRFSAFSLRGTNHAVNQDSFHCSSGQFWGVADGVGGGAFGEVASQMLLSSMAELKAPLATDIHNKLHEADGRINTQIRSLGQGMGAAVMACLWIQGPGQCLAAHVGDCKVLHLRKSFGNWKIKWFSTDQTYVNQEVEPPPGVSLQAPSNMVGCGMTSEAQMYSFKLKGKDRVVLCSDGFSSQLSKKQVSELVVNDPWPLQTESAKIWCQSARSNGSQDDITVLILEPEDQFTLRAYAAMATVITLFFLVWLISGGRQ
jgi:serine/threonine protein phosphatase PrpC